MEVNIGKITVKKTIRIGGVIITDRPILVVASLPTVYRRQNVLYCVVSGSTFTGYIWDGSAWKQTAGGSGGGTWGTITGTLSDQTDLNTALGLKVDKITGKGLSTNDYTTAEQSKLTGIEAGAQVNIIETVKVNGVALTPTSKAVDIPTLTKLTSSVTIAVADWSGGTTCVKSVSGLLATDTILPTLSDANLTLAGTARLRAFNPTNGQLDFVCTTTPTSPIVFDFEILR